MTILFHPVVHELKAQTLETLFPPRVPFLTTIFLFLIPTRTKLQTGSTSPSTTMEPFTLIEKSASAGPHHLFDDVLRLSSARTADHDLQYLSILREANPGLIVTCIPASNVNLRTFAAAGFAFCELDIKTDSYASLRGYVSPRKRSDKGQLGEAISFAKYHYHWNSEDFILYTAGNVQYVLKDCQGSEHVLGPSKTTDALIQAIGDWLMSILDVVWVYDNYWTQSKELWEQVQKSSWDNVILDEDMKKELTEVANRFFDSKEVYEELGVPWKRGLLFHGPPGNGKTISIRALMHTLYDRKDPIPTLYVRDAPFTYDIGAVFRQARALAPCMLVLEDIETIVTQETRSYFFNEMDGLENNDGLFVVASTNFLDRLDPGLSKRPSRFDRKYNFPLPSEHERTLCCEFWRRKLKSNKSIEFPEKLCPAMAHITSGFSFAFLQECFVATLLVLARERDEAATRAFDGENEDLEDYKLWVAFKEQADVLRKEVEGQKTKPSQLVQWCRSNRVPSTPSAVMASSAGGAGECSCRGCHETERRPLSTAITELKLKDEPLPELPYYNQKRRYINSAAYEWRNP